MEKSREEEKQNKDDNLPIQHHEKFHDYHINDETQNESLSKVLRNLASSMRQQQQQQNISLKSLREENFLSKTMQAAMASTSTSSSSMMTTMKRETTGGNEYENQTDEANRSETAKSMMEMSACPIGRTMFIQQQRQQQQQQQSIASSSSSSLASSSTSMETVKRIKTLSFLHNEDLFDTAGTTSLPLAMPEDKSVAATSPLFRSMSFQERRQYQHQASLKRVESGKEFKTTSGAIFDSNARKVTIISPKHSLYELNDRIRQIQHQMFGDSSSDMSL